MSTVLLKRVILFTLLLNVFFEKLKVQVEIGDNPTTLNSASLLELETTNKGFVLPRVSFSLNHKMIAIIPVKPVSCAKPHEALFILRYAADITLRKAIINSYSFKL